MSNSAIDIFGAYVDNFKNKLINGNFDFWQRGRGVASAFNESISTSSAAETFYIPDRWFRGFTSDISDTIGFTAERKVFVSSDFGSNGLKIKSRPDYYIDFSGTFTTGNGASQYLGLGQRIENVRTLSGKQATLSFWAKGSVTGSFTVRLSQVFGSTGPGLSDRVDLTQKTVNINVADAWNRYVFTLDIPDVAGATQGTKNDDYLEVFFTTHNSWGFAGLTGNVNLGATVDYNGTISLAEVQLEEGPTATLFDKRMVGIEQIMCERYFELGSVDYATHSRGSNNYLRVPFKTKKKAFNYFPDQFLTLDDSGGLTFANRFGTSGVTFEDTYKVYHSIAGITGGVPVDGDEFLNADASGITFPTPDGFSIHYNTDSGSAKQTKVRGLWAVDAEL